MYAHFLFTAIALVLYMGPDPGGELPAWTLGESARACAALALAYGALGWLPVLLHRGRLAGPIERLSEEIYRLHRTTSLYRGLILAVYAADLYLFGWKEQCRVLGSAWAERGVPLWDLAEIALALAPFWAAMVLSWIPYYAVFQRLHPPPHGLGRYLWLQGRQYLSMVVGIGVILLLFSVVPLDALARRLPWLPRGLAQWLGYAAVLVAAYLAVPLFLRLLWKIRPLPDGPLRERLARLAKAESFPLDRIRVWETGSRILNACTIGLVPRFRYILLSDGLLEQLSEEEIEAVLAHELGHVHHRHFLHYLTYALALVSVLLLLDPWLHPLERGFGFFLAETVGVMLGAWGVLFSFLSRRFERQADLFAADRLGDAGRIQQALARLSTAGGQPRRLRTLTHGSIEKRIDFLAAADAQPARAAALHRLLHAATTGLLVILLGSLCVLAFR